MNHIVRVTNMVSTVCLDACLRCVNITGHGTVILEELADESLHADFDKHYQGFIVKDLDASSYPCVCPFAVCMCVFVCVCVLLIVFYDLVL